MTTPRDPEPFDKHNPKPPNSGMENFGLRPPTVEEAAKARNAYPFPLVAAPPLTLPSAWTLGAWPVQNQGPRGSCGFFAVLRAAMQERQRVIGVAFDPSEEALYTQFALDEGSACQDTGAWPLTVADIICKKGVAPEWMMPYLSTNLCGPITFEVREAMSAERGMLYAICPSDAEIKAAIVAGNRVCACFSLTQSFDHLIQVDHGEYEMPHPQGQIVGHHAMDFYGFDDHRQTAMGVGAFAMQNQWGYDSVIWVPYQLCHMSGWQQGGPGLWYDATVTIYGWNGHRDPIYLPEPEPEPDPDPLPDGEYLRGFYAARDLIAEYVTELQP